MSVAKLVQAKRDLDTGLFLKPFQSASLCSQCTSCIHRELSLAVRKYTTDRLWGHNNCSLAAIICTSQSAVNTRTVTTQYSPTTCNQAVQTTPVVISEPQQVLDNEQQLVHIHPSAFSLFKVHHGKARYNFKKDGAQFTLTWAQFREQYPTERPPTYTPEATKRKAVALAIRRCISKRYREHEATRKQQTAKRKSNQALTPLLALRKTKSINNLQSFFLQEFIAKGEQGLPVRMEVSDPEDTDPEYEDLVKTTYHAKPPRIMKLCSENSWHLVRWTASAKKAAQLSNQNNQARRTSALKCSTKKKKKKKKKISP